MVPRKPFLQLVQERVVCLDGAMGSNLQTRPLELKRDWLGHENASEILNLSRPDIIQEIHFAVWLDRGNQRRGIGAGEHLIAVIGVE